jgi:signal transduction histidine kinase
MDIYYFIFLIFPLSTGLSTYRIINKKSTSSFVTILGGLGAVWTLLQIRDFFVLWFFNGTFFGPSIITVMTGILTYFRYKDAIHIETESEILKLNIKSKETITQLSVQIAHDIRAPLSFLNALLNDRNMPTDGRDGIRLVSERLTGIVNHLLAENRNLNQTNPQPFSAQFIPSNEPITQTQISSILKNMTQEKHHVIQNSEKITLTLEISATTSKAECNIQPTEFNRIISNLLDNSIESIQSNGQIQIKQTTSKTHISILIQDNGSGIPESVLAKLGQPGFSFGKKNGNGLGIFHAKNTIESWGGTLQIHSKENQGTTVEITLPLKQST